MLKSINHDLIYALTTEGYRIIVIQILGEIQYWASHKFEPNTLGSEPIDNINFSGINITSFVDKTVIANMKPIDIVNMLEVFIKDKVSLQVKMTKESQWQLFSI